MVKALFSVQLIIASLFLVSCSATEAFNASEVFREESAKRIAAPVFMLPRDVTANDFTFKVYERVYEAGAPSMLYFEGDGDDARTFEKDPGPLDPIGLKLAAQDAHKNVIYIARACQYVGEANICPDSYWKSARYAPEVIDAMNIAISKLKSHHDISGYHFVGYGGGATVASLLAAKRSDVLSLRTVAGILDTRFYANINNTEYPEGSLNPIDFASSLRDLPQRHFVGQGDVKVPPAIYYSYQQAMGGSACANINLIDNTTHKKGWVEQWKVLQALPVTCEQAPMPEIFDTDSMDLIGGIKR